MKKELDFSRWDIVLVGERQKIECRREVTDWRVLLILDLESGLIRAFDPLNTQGRAWNDHSSGKAEQAIRVVSEQAGVVEAAGISEFKSWYHRLLTLRS